MTPLRFCMVTTFYPPYNFGGDGVAVQHLARALVRRGHHVTVIHDRDAWHALARGTAPPVAGEDDGVRTIGLRSALRVLAPLLTQQTGRPVVHGKALRAELANGYDVVHFHNVSLVGGPGVLSYAPANAVRLYTAHEHWLVCPTHTLWRHQREPCTGRECLRCGLHYHRPPQWWRDSRFFDRQLAEVDAFIALSEFSRAKHHEFGFPREMEVLPLFLPDRAGDPADEPGTTPARPYFLYVGRLERLKGAADAIRAFQQYPDADLLLAGEGSESDALRRLAAGSPNIRFLGQLNEVELRRRLRHALALVVPTRGYETFGLVLIEALREGTPVIARRIGPFPEIVERSGGGELFSTVAELRAALVRMQHDVAYRAACGRSGRQAFRAHWHEDVVVPCYLELIERARPTRVPAEVAPPITRRVAV